VLQATTTAAVWSGHPRTTGTACPTVHHSHALLCRMRGALSQRSPPRIPAARRTGTVTARP